jgi:hypothetical protein
MATEATVEESAMLVSRVTGRPREVDVVIRTLAAAHEVVVSVEATSSRRVATVEWVERMIGKHANLPTDKLVLVSESGFRTEAREVAAAAGVAVFAPEDVESDDPVAEVLNQLRSLWPKLLSFYPESVNLCIDDPNEGLRWISAPPGLSLFLPDGSRVGALADVLGEQLTASLGRIVEPMDLSSIGEDVTRSFVAGNDGPWIVDAAGASSELRLLEDETGLLVAVRGFEMRGTAEVRVVEVDLMHRRLGDVVYAFGEGSVGDRPALVVLTEDGSASQMTIRLRETGGVPSEEIAFRETR